jgi:HK97 family phage portal protein
LESPVTRAINAPGRFLAAVGNATVSGAKMMFARGSGAWQLLFARTKIDYKAEVGDPFNSSIVAAVVGWITRNFPEAPVRLLKEGAGRDQGPGVAPGPTGPGHMLRLLERPNDYYSGVLQWMATVADFIQGNAYWVKVRNGSGRVVGLWWVPASLMEPRWPADDPTVFISHYEYRVDNQVFGFGSSEVVHFRNGIDPRNPRKGLSRFGSLLREIFTDEEAANFTAQLLRNLGVPGVIMAPSNVATGRASFDPTEADNVKKEFEERFGGDNRGRLMTMSTPTDIKVLSWSPEQMNLRALRRIPEERVSAVLGVPAGVAQLGAGLDRNTFTNYGEANVAAYTQGVIPLQRLLAAELEVQLLPEFGGTAADTLDVWFDWTQASAFMAYFAEIWKRHESAATKGLITRADFKRAVGKTPASDGTDDIYIVPNNMQIVSAGGGSPSPSGLLLPGRPQGANGHHPELTAGVAV